MTNPIDPPVELTYGSTVHLWQKDLGYLCAGKPVDETALPGVSRPVTGSDEKNKAQVQSIWRVIPAGMSAVGWRKRFGQQVKVGDTIHLLSCSLSSTPSFPDAGYLDSCEEVSRSSALRSSLTGDFKADKVVLGIITHSDPNRDAGSGSWSVGKDGGAAGDLIHENDSVSLKNGYSFNDKQGWLVAYSSPRSQPESFDDYEAEGQVTDVFTSTADDLGGTQRWTLVPVDFSTLKRSSEL